MDPSADVVGKKSAYLPSATIVGLSADHENMNKFSNKKGPYRDVIYRLKRIYEPVVESKDNPRHHYVSERHHSKCRLIEVLANDDPRKSQKPVVEYVYPASILPVSLLFQVLSPSKALARNIL
jgi:hypothetical protein